MRDMLEQLLCGKDLTEAQGRRLLEGLTDESVDLAVKGALLAALRAKGETGDELCGMALAMREAAHPFETSWNGPTVDTCGTGGDGSHSINISTAASLVVASLGIKVVKHGNRSVSSKSGSADVLEALGISLPSTPEMAVQRFAEHGWTFLFAPVFHPAMKAVVPVRRALKVRTAFNLLGPLTNPARPSHQLLGAFSVDAAEKMAMALSGMDVQHAYVVHGAPHWDEATPMGPFTVFDVVDGAVSRREVDPIEYGVPRCTTEDLAGGDAHDNALALRRVFEGRQGPHADAIALNAALVLELLDRPSPMQTVRLALSDGTVANYVAGLADV
jgi:anthranilate phosphoribosyltransferase